MSMHLPISEHDLQKLILDYLALHRVFHYRQNTGAFAAEYKGKKRFVRFGVKGLPDIICVVQGRYIGIELKREKLEQSKAQVEFQVGLEHAKGKYILARTLEDVIQGLREAP